MPLTGFANGAAMDASQVQQLIDLLKGVMTDQPVVLRHASTVPLTLDRSDAAGIKGLLVGQRAAATKWLLGLDASDQFAVLNAAGNAVNLGITDVGAGTFRGGLTLGGALAILGTLTGVTIMQVAGGASAGSIQVNPTSAAFTSALNNIRIYIGNAATDSGAFDLFKGGVIEWQMRIQQGVGASDLQFGTGSSGAGVATLTTAGLLTLLSGLSATDVKATGVSGLGSAAAGRYVGNWTTTGAPTGLTGVVGDHGFDGNMTLWVCTVAGTPGTWKTATSVYRARVFRNAAYNVTSNSVSIVYLFDAENEDPNGNYAASAYTAPVPGRYRIDSRISWATSVTTLYAAFVNGTEALRGSHGVSVRDFQIHGELVLAAGDVVDARINIADNVAHAMDVAAAVAYFQIAYMGSN